MALWRRRTERDLPEDWEEVVAARVAGWWDLTVAHRTRLRDRMLPLVLDTRWEAARGFEVTDEVRLVVASQAARLLAGLELDRFPNVGNVIVRATSMVVAEERAGPVPGVVSDDPFEIVGEAGHGQGPILLAWDEVLWDVRHPRRGRNVVIHEFAHKLDMLDDVVDGTPPLVPVERRADWIRVCTALFEELREEGSPVLDDYGATDPGEFFAVATEAFFTRAGALRTHHGDLYELLAASYQQDPAA